MTTTQRGSKSTLIVDTIQVEMFSGGSGPAGIPPRGGAMRDGKTGMKNWPELYGLCTFTMGFNGTERPRLGLHDHRCRSF